MALDKLTKVQSVGISSFIQVVGVVTATGGFVGDVTGTTSNASGATGDFSIADKIVHTGDTNTALRFPAADTFTVETGGSERLRVTSAGNIGIGTDNPQVDLHLHDSTNTRIQFTDDSVGVAAGDGVIMGLNGDDDFFINNRESSKSLLLFTENTERARITSGGDVGIGTDNPVGSLEVRDSKANLIVAKDGLTVKSNSDLHTSYDTLQLGAGGGLASYSVATATADTQFTHNAYRHSGGNWKYRYTDTAARLRVNSPW